MATKIANRGGFVAKKYLALCLALALGLVGCSGYVSLKNADSARILGFYSMGGLAAGGVIVFDSGTVIVDNLAGTTMRRSVRHHPSFKNLMASLAQPDFGEELAALDALRHEDLCSHCDEIYIETAGREVTVLAEKADELTPAVRQVLEDLDVLALAVMQHRLDFQLNIEKSPAY